MFGKAQNKILAKLLDQKIWGLGCLSARVNCGVAWNTPNMINLRGDVVGFANASEADGGNQNFRPFLKRPDRAIGLEALRRLFDGDEHIGARGVYEL